MVKISVLTLPGPMVSGTNTLLKPGLAACTEVENRMVKKEAYNNILKTLLNNPMAFS